MAHGLVGWFLLQSGESSPPDAIVIGTRESIKESENAVALPKKKKVSRAESSPAAVAPTGTGNEGEIFGEDLGIVAQYPRLSRLLGESGRVQIGLSRDGDGKWGNAEVRRSSGFSRLDEAALSATRAALLKGLAHDLKVRDENPQITFVFRLKDDTY